jgi:hypothetical protein
MAVLAALQELSRAAVRFLRHTGLPPHRITAIGLEVRHVQHDSPGLRLRTESLTMR